ncbi:MAG TPA: 30S ribosomal protein S6 [Thermomicrobiales bacterium]|nr:30S ribosomal protein S6 [Thermomicrobiales bacterium]
MRGTTRDPRTYELMTVFAPDIPEEEIQVTIDRVVGYITTATGDVTDINRDSPWGRRRLAYPIRHQSRDVRDGFYTLYHFNVAPNRVEEIERELKLNDRVIRYLVTQYTPRPVEEPATTEAAPAEGEKPADEATPAVAIAADAVPAAEATVAEEPQTAPAPEPDATTEPATATELDTATEPAAAADEGSETESADGEADTAEATPPEEA